MVLDHEVVGDQHRQFSTWFSGQYHTRTGHPYIVTAGKDGQLVKGLLKQLSLEELQQAARRMLTDPWGSTRASIGLLAS